ncbi:MAG TPA: cellulase family glycosylhydrolase [Chitinophagaceae bacterium]|nr:cellulase family glycosylhydrolase [Chitinophagaceae bacterium]
MKNKFMFWIAGTVVLVLNINACKKAETSPQLSVSNITDTIPADGGTVSVSFTCSSSWSIDTTGIGWVKLNQLSGNSGNVNINLTAAANTNGISRSVLLNLNADNGQARRITVFQSPVIFPSYNTSPIAGDSAGMGSTAAQITANIKLGWNIFNTMEAPGGETGWGNPVVTQALIDLVKQSGVNAIRIPCSWNFHASQTTAKIDPAWMSRVKQVVQYCINDGMYVMLNDHWDGGWLDCTATGANLDTIKARQKAFWEQIATSMRDFDEHLMFASSNEPNATDLATSTNLYSFHQIFINAVRSTGGKNGYRALVIQAPSTSIDLANYFAPGGLPGLPADAVPNKLIMEAHWYTPPNFCILSSDASWGKEWRYWGANYHSTDDTTRNATAATEESYIDSSLSYANKRFVKAGVPLLIGEFDAPDHSVNIIGNPADSILSLNSRAHFFKYLVQQARLNGIPAFLWAGGVYNRQNNTISDKQVLDSLRAGAGF